MTIRAAINTLISAVPGAPFSETVDVVKIGDASQELKGIVVCFLATTEIIFNSYSSPNSFALDDVHQLSNSTFVPYPVLCYNCFGTNNL
jgi:hypothetical protein